MMPGPAIAAAPELPDAALSYLTVAGATPSESFAAGAPAGFGAVTLRAVPMGKRPEDSGAAAVSLRLPDDAGARRIAVADVEYVEIHADLDVSCLDPLLEAGSRVGARFINAMCTDPVEERATESFGELCRAAQEYGLAVGLEFSSYSAVTSVEMAHRMVEGVNNSAAVVVVDALHPARAGGTPSDVSVRVDRRPDLYPVLHLCDAPRALGAPTLDALAFEARNDRLLPGQGQLPLEELVAAVPVATHYVEVPSRSMGSLRFMGRARLAAASLISLRSRVMAGSRITDRRKSGATQ